MPGSLCSKSFAAAMVGLCPLTHAARRTVRRTAPGSRALRRIDPRVRYCLRAPLGEGHEHGHVAPILCVFRMDLDQVSFFEPDRARAERILALNPLDGRALSLGSLSLYEEGQLERALAWSRRSLELYPDDMSALINATCLRARMGLKEEALQTLQCAFSRGWGKRDWVERDPDYDLLRDDPRFEQLLAKLK